MKKIRRCSFNKAFTLAEVLITLGIIGVVAAITIPAIIQGSQKQELKTGLKEAYSVLSNAYNRLKADQGMLTNDSTLWNYYFSASIDPKQFANDLTIYLNITKNLSDWQAFSTQTYKDFQGNVIGSPTSPHYVGEYEYILQNGMILFVSNTAPAVGAGIIVCVDVNGFKGPNIIGKDVFRFDVTTQNTLIPYNIVFGHSWACTTAIANTSAFGCPSAAFTDDTYWNLW